MSNKLTQRLEQALGIINETQFAQRGGAVVWIGYRTQHPHAAGRTSPRAVVHALVDGEWKTKTFYAREHGGATAAADRKGCVEAAQAWVSARLGREVDWVPGPYRDAWMPREVRERVLAELKATEAAAN